MWTLLDVDFSGQDVQTDIVAVFAADSGNPVDMRWQGRQAGPDNSSFTSKIRLAIVVIENFFINYFFGTVLDCMFV